MRTEFPEYYPMSPEAYKSLAEEAVFSLDANVLLAIYKNSQPLRDRLFAVLEALQDRMWIPHQAALEFHINRIEVLRELQKPVKEIQDLLNDARTKTQQVGPDLFLRKDRVGEVAAIINRAQDIISAAQIEGFENIGLTDPLKERMSALLDGKVGPPFTPSALAEKHKEAAQRHANEVPPGYKDSPQPGKASHYGDIVLWFQLLDRVASEEHNRKPLVFVTNDVKEDWWSLFGRNRIGPRVELIAEMHERGVLFHMYTLKGFLEHMSQHIGLPRLDQGVFEEAVITSGTAFSRMTNEELRRRAGETVASIRRVAAAYQREENRLRDLEHIEFSQATDEEERSRAWNKFRSVGMQLSEAFRNEVSDTMMEAELLRDELLARLPPISRESHIDHLYATSTSPHWAMQAANDLFKLSKHLP